MSGGFDAFWAPKSHTPSPFACPLLGSPFESAPWHALAPRHIPVGRAPHPRLPAWIAQSPKAPRGLPLALSLGALVWIRPPRHHPGMFLSCLLRFVSARRQTPAEGVFAVSRTFMTEPDDSDPPLPTEGHAGLAWVNPTFRSGGKGMGPFSFGRLATLIRAKPRREAPADLVRANPAEGSNYTEGKSWCQPLWTNFLV